MYLALAVAILRRVCANVLLLTNIAFNLTEFFSVVDLVHTREGDTGHAPAAEAAAAVAADLRTAVVAAEVAVIQSTIAVVLAVGHLPAVLPTTVK